MHSSGPKCIYEGKPHGWFPDGTCWYSLQNLPNLKYCHFRSIHTPSPTEDFLKRNIINTCPKLKIWQLRNIVCENKYAHGEYSNNDGCSNVLYNFVLLEDIRLCMELKVKTLPSVIGLYYTTYVKGFVNSLKNGFLQSLKVFIYDNFNQYKIPISANHEYQMNVIKTEGLVPAPAIGCPNLRFIEIPMLKIFGRVMMG